MTGTWKGSSVTQLGVLSEKAGAGKGSWAHLIYDQHQNIRGDLSLHHRGAGLDETLTRKGQRLRKPSFTKARMRVRMCQGSQNTWPKYLDISKAQEPCLPCLCLLQSQKGNS